MGEEEEDLEKVREELREAFRLYDKEGKLGLIKNVWLVRWISLVPKFLFF